MNRLSPVEDHSRKHPVKYEKIMKWSSVSILYLIVGQEEFITTSLHLHDCHVSVSVQIA
jgi:hypothetical protein